MSDSLSCSFICISCLTKKRLKIPKGGNQNLYIEEEQTTQCPKKKSTKGQTTIYKIYAYETKDRVTRTPLKTGGELMCSGRVSSSCSTSGTRRVNLVSGGEEDGSYSLFC